MPVPSQLHVDTGLTNLAILNPMADSFIGPMLFPVVPVGKQSDKIFHVDPTAETMRNHDDIRAPGTEANRVDFAVDSSLTYFCDDHAIDLPVTDEEKANADQGAMVALDRASFGLNIIRRNMEINVVSTIDGYFTSGLTSTPTNKWNTYSGGSAGDPIADINAKISALELSSGISPNSMGMDISVARAIVQHPDVQSRYVSVQTQGQMKSQGYATILTDLFNLDNVFIAKIANYNSAAKGATASFSRIWDDNVFLGYVGPINLTTACAGCIPVWNAGLGNQGVNAGAVVRSIRADLRASDIIRSELFYDVKPLRASAYKASVCGHWFKDVLA